ncbi:hypothetical protein PHYBLDRAFT_153642 [Phycomyces blakesleeanus NRRL 1555(-)]|uniref:Uncharacterized protein n=1 Tax=Phycomyces blakesleeanus (strain ATCC 8743b / DSM 1359 / FGSC 10004 / NBRC 33097 / NRRL 1555) TaxID=763407 RepID=A0A162W822_PHYB8|nr:hypothetical protein PHYBLDRAFT_153642 [Phycomyces blakesleeanus NRRL 1555(-)]OAD65255.1 hypothetical protein PHYBLDRAFT_153642 [Phycomyces blakesleeanus NRRL 1555(-)]|eukprot:XP_018283295.1 hypothetical protein PHYBLDRAFT_153642 [Phycomyces blakesleeanus NRRL 1555(-)]
MAEHGRQVVGGQGFPERRLWDEYQMSMGTVQIIIIFRVASHTVHFCGHCDKYGRSTVVYGVLTRQGVEYRAIAYVAGGVMGVESPKMNAIV